MASALGNAVDASEARGFLRDFANDASRMHRRLARMNVQEVTDANEVNAPVAATDPAAEQVPVAPTIIADNVPVATPAATVNVSVEQFYVAIAAPVPTIPVVPGVTPAAAAAAAAAAVPVGINILLAHAALASTVAVTPQPAIVPAMDPKPVHALSLAAVHANPSPVALAIAATRCTE